MITIIDYGLGNLGSILNMCKKIQVPAEITRDISKISAAKKILLPGVGAFDIAMQKIEECGILPVLNQKALVDKVPFLGICLGMQILTERSDEGTLPGLGFINGETKKFVFEDSTLKIPHMGWNTIINMKDSQLTLEMDKEEYRFYFVHSYYVKCKNEADVVCKTTHGIKFDSIIQNENIYGAQFHPEKSHRFGMKLLSNFASI